MIIQIKKINKSEDEWVSNDKKSKEELQILNEKTFNEARALVKNLEYNFITVQFDVEWWESYIMIIVYLDNLHDRIIPSIELSLQIQDWEDWNKPWSMSSFANKFEENVKQLNNLQFIYYQEDPDSMLNGFGITYFPSNSNLKIKFEIEYIFSIVEKLLLDTNKNLQSSLNDEVILTYFHFPVEIKTACKQYLVYFAQFIADLGIIVNTELKEELNHTLFKIIPENKEESLERIKEALNIYLKAPSDINFPVLMSNQTDIAAKQWEANIYFLKSQLSLATSIIQAKDSAIEMLQLSNYQYKQLLESPKGKKESETEEIIKGIVTVKKYDGKGFSIDFAEILRRLKRAIK